VKKLLFLILILLGILLVSSTSKAIASHNCPAVNTVSETNCPVCPQIGERYEQRQGTPYPLCYNKNGQIDQYDDCLPNANCRAYADPKNSYACAYNPQMQAMFSSQWWDLQKYLSPNGCCSPDNHNCFTSVINGTPNLQDMSKNPTGGSGDCDLSTESDPSNCKLVGQQSNCPSGFVCNYKDSNLPYCSADGKINKGKCVVNTFGVCKTKADCSGTYVCVAGVCKPPDIGNTCCSCGSGFNYNESDKTCIPMTGGSAKPADCTKNTCTSNQTCDHTTGKCEQTGIPNLIIPPPHCDVEFVNGKCPSIKSALGNLFTDPAKLINSFFIILLSISGFIAVILIIISGYKIMVSQGNPEKLKDAREELIAAIVGLLFIIFSFVFLQTIAQDILKLPGFGS
jgi:hypothetical protein